MKKLRVLLSIFLLVFLISSNTMAFAYNSYDEVFRGAYDATTRWGSPVKNSSGSIIWPTINSKWSEPRKVGTTPHVGVDIPLVAGTPIAAVMTGTVYPQYDRYNTLSQRYGSTSLYCHYEHMDSISISSGTVSKGSTVGLSGAVGADGAYHLHFGAYDTIGMVNRLAYRNETFYRDASSWNYGRNVDVYSQCIWSNNTAKLTAVFSGTNNTHDELPAEVIIFYRVAGSSVWINGGAMSRSGFDYSYSFTGKYPSGTNIQWTARIKRNISISVPYLWAPSKYYNPSIDPNSNSYPYAYFSNIIS
ncbi:MAG: hypothetical protein BGO41_10595 [Clostridiales bacterium 38-18]|nr:MAG: hypothetical protein BGO41_10595 [Clostridiales bacterium 38-18]